MVCAVVARGADTDDNYGFKGISAVNLIIEDLDSAAAKIGLTKAAVRTDVELRLRIAGVKLVPEQQIGEHILHVMVTFLTTLWRRA